MPRRNRAATAAPSAPAVVVSRRERSRTPAAVALPADVRLMNGVASSVYGLAVVALLVLAVLWLTRAPVFTFRAIRIDGDVGRNSPGTIRANALPALRGNFFSLDLQQARTAFESVPWVRHAVLRRVWPDTLLVRLEEHRAAALWKGDDGTERLVNDAGEVFDANIGDVEDDSLPLLAGPDGTSRQMLDMLHRLQPVLGRSERAIETLQLSGRGSWRVELDNGARLELGRGDGAQVAERAARFVATLPRVAERWQQPVVYADLRHADGYALRLRGVTTTTAAATPPPNRKSR